MDRTERLLDLVALLLDAHEPVSWAELKESFPDDYGSGSDEATERKFERDKAELARAGHPAHLRARRRGRRQDGYLLDRSAYYLPELRLHPRGDGGALRRRLGRARLGAFPGTADLAHALRKIGFFAGGELADAAGADGARRGPARGRCPEQLETLWSRCQRAQVGRARLPPPRRPEPSTSAGRPLRPGPPARRLVPGGLLPPSPGAPAPSTSTASGR